MKISKHILFIIILQAFLAGLMLEYVIRYDKIHQPQLNLPKEINLITKQDTLKGYWKNNVLHIEFNNKRNH